MSLELRNVIFAWPDSEPCVKVSELSIAASQSVFLYGPSGSGKSTLLGLVGGVLKPQQGSIVVNHHELTSMTDTQRDAFRGDHIGFIFQQFNLIPYLSVLDNVLLPCQFSRYRQQRALEKSSSLTQAATALLDRLALPKVVWSKSAAELSVGQQQRVAVARALIGSPEIIIADEPTSALDAQTQTAFMDLLLRQCDEVGSTLLFVSHDTRLAKHFSKSLNLLHLNTAQQSVSL